MLYLKFTRRKNIESKTLHCYDITQSVKNIIEDNYSIEDAYQICALVKSDNDVNYADSAAGEYIITSGKTIKYNSDHKFYNQSVIAKNCKIVAVGRLEKGLFGYKCKDAVEIFNTAKNFDTYCK